MLFQVIYVASSLDNCLEFNFHDSEISILIASGIIYREAFVFVFLFSKVSSLVKSKGEKNLLCMEFTLVKC